MSDKDNKENIKDVAAKSYIVNYYNSVSALTDAYATYINLILELEERYKDVETDKKLLEDEEREALRTWSQQIRFLCHKIYILYKTIEKKQKLAPSAEFERNYSSISTKYIIKQEELKDFVMFLQDSLLNDVIQTLLHSSLDTISELYGN